jgi:hypothetical protein
VRWCHPAHDVNAGGWYRAGLRGRPRAKTKTDTDRGDPFLWVNIKGGWYKNTALVCWRTCGPSGQARCSGAAVKASLMARTAFQSHAAASRW